jgi:uncharacterized membrane protein (DUF2068 family)
MDTNAKTAGAKDRAPTLYFIAIGKLAKGVVLLLVAAGIYSLAGKDLQDLFDRFLEWVHIDPEHRFFSNISDWLSGVQPHSIRATALATFLYGIFLLVGGTGLAIRAKWAIWLTIGESAFFIPIEIFELTRPHVRPVIADQPPSHPHLLLNPKAGLLIILALNIFIVGYLYKNRERLFRHRD